MIEIAVVLEEKETTHPLDEGGTSQERSPGNLKQGVTKPYQHRSKETPSATGGAGPGSRYRNLRAINEECWACSAPTRGRLIETRRNRHKKRPSHLGALLIRTHAEVHFPDLGGEEGKGQEGRLDTISDGDTSSKACAARWDQRKGFAEKEEQDEDENGGISSSRVALIWLQRKMVGIHQDIL